MCFVNHAFDIDFIMKRMLEPVEIRIILSSMRKFVLLRLFVFRFCSISRFGSNADSQIVGPVPRGPIPASS